MASVQPLPVAAPAAAIPATQLTSLIEEHDDLDRAIAALLESCGFDELVVARLKKRKLQLKDAIARCEPLWLDRAMLEKAAP